MKNTISAEKTSTALSKKPAHKDIARLAQALYEKEGRPEGKHLEHWFNAESMIESNFGYGDSHTEPGFSGELRVQIARHFEGGAPAPTRAEGD